MPEIAGFDKLLHFLVSYAIALSNPLLAFAGGIAKEVYDALGGGTADVLDFAADLAGILAALMFG